MSFFSFGCVIEVSSDEAVREEEASSKEVVDKKKEAEKNKPLDASSAYKAPTKENTLSADYGGKTGSSYKKGSQGGVKPARTGNDDEDDDHRGLLPISQASCKPDCLDCETECGE